MKNDRTTLRFAIALAVLGFAPLGAAEPADDGQAEAAKVAPGDRARPRDPGGRPGHGPDGPPGHGPQKPGHGPPGAAPSDGPPGAHGGPPPFPSGVPHARGPVARAARLDELLQKEAAGTLTDAEKAELERMKRMQQKFEQLQKKHDEHSAHRDDRRHEAKKEALRRFPGYAKNPAAREEFQKHARRVARLERAKDVAEAEGRNDLVGRIDQLIAKENARHQAWLDKHAAPAPKGTQP